MFHDIERITPSLVVAGISGRNRQLLSKLHALTAPFSAEEAAPVLGLSVQGARRRLAYLAERGWLVRVSTGLYSTVPLDASKPHDWREDPWVIADRIFAPCYIAGWSACEYWELTDQIFRAIAVITARPIRHRHTVVQGTDFKIKHLAAEKLFGTVEAWRRTTKVSVSDPTRTIVDILADPALGGGIVHVNEVLEAYFRGKHRRDDLLVEYALRLNATSVFKRLGYLLETLNIHAQELTDECLRRRQSGVILLDPSLPKQGPVTTRWNLRVNAASLISGARR